MFLLVFVFFFLLVIVILFIIKIKDRIVKILYLGKIIVEIDRVMIFVCNVKFIENIK